MLVETRNIVKQYPGVRAIDHASVSISPGEILGLAGRNGAGKSTLIKILAGAIQPDSGELLLDGVPTVIKDPLDATRKGLGFVHQDLTDIPGMSVAENVHLGLGYPRQAGLFVDRRRLRRGTRAILERIGADIDPDVQVGRLRVAERRLVTIARGLAADARLFVLDEPTASLTETEIDHLHAVLRGLAAEGVGIMYVSHRLDEMFSISDRVVVMRDGMVVADARTDEIDRPALIAHITGHQAAEAAADGLASGRAKHAGSEFLRAENFSSSVVRDVTFAANSGEVLGIAGLVGAGRTELARLIFGADRATTGTLFVHGKPVELKHPADAMKAGVAFLPEDRRAQSLILDFSIRENASLPSLPNSRRWRYLPITSRRVESGHAKRLMSELEIKAPGPERKVRWLSGGNQQKVVFGKWLQRKADVIIVDEPTHGVDIRGKDEFHRLLRELADDGRAVIFISSEFAELVKVCDRVLVMAEGRMVAEVPREQLSVATLVQACYAAHGTTT